MKKAILISALFLAGNAMGAQDLCGVQVQDNNVINTTKGESVNYVRAILKADNATIKECFTEKGAVVVGIAPNGEIRAVIF